MVVVGSPRGVRVRSGDGDQPRPPPPTLHQQDAVLKYDSCRGDNNTPAGRRSRHNRLVSPLEQQSRVFKLHGRLSTWTIAYSAQHYKRLERKIKQEVARRPLLASPMILISTLCWSCFSGSSI